jgi:cytochrome oxidase assembly protein ShyY1
MARDARLAQRGAWRTWLALLLIAMLLAGIAAIILAVWQSNLDRGIAVSNAVILLIAARHVAQVLWHGLSR